MSLTVAVRRYGGGFLAGVATARVISGRPYTEIRKKRWLHSEEEAAAYVVELLGGRAVEKKEANEGWLWPHAGRRWHYFRDGRSLCGDWGMMPGEEQHLVHDERPDPDDCRRCRRKLEGT